MTPQEINAIRESLGKTTDADFVRPLGVRGPDGERFFGHRVEVTEAGRDAMQADQTEQEIADLEAELYSLKRLHRIQRQNLCVDAKANGTKTAAEAGWTPTPEKIPVRGFTRGDTFAEFFAYVNGLKTVGVQGWFLLDAHDPDMLNVMVLARDVAEVVEG